MRAKIEKIYEKFYYKLKLHAHLKNILIIILGLMFLIFFVGSPVYIYFSKGPFMIAPLISLILLVLTNGLISNPWIHIFEMVHLSMAILFTFKAFIMNNQYYAGIFFVVISIVLIVIGVYMSKLFGNIRQKIDKN